MNFCAQGLRHSRDASIRQFYVRVIVISAGRRDLSDSRNQAEREKLNKRPFLRFNVALSAQQSDQMSVCV